MCIIAVIVFLGVIYVMGMCLHMWYMSLCVHICVWHMYRYILPCVCVGVWYMCMCVLLSKCVLYACIADDNFEYVLLFAVYDVILINNKPES